MMNKEPKCKYCWDKGYATQLVMEHTSADFFGDKEYNQSKVYIVPCMRCHKWKRSKKVREKAEKEALELIRKLAE